ncbi:ABC transporter substrate-binding protein [uncultured Clostridium sp.]|uniref:ABC transporter substrate-binding protein n=1 Tax=uncultured Clostridium sp. TaxID=59620 RepID=UPI0025CE0B01|nr:ABC transporter substrate-binding protein [uncultured Clostridium sp.]
MKKIKGAVCIFSAVILSVGMLVGCGDNSPTTKNSSNQGNKNSYKEVAITDTLQGKKFREKFTEPPKRAVSLAGFTTEMMLSLGLADDMVGRAYQDNKILDKLTNDYKKVPKLSDKNPSKEKLLSVQPDFLTGWDSSFSEKNFDREFCKKNDIKIYVPKSVADNANIDMVYEDFEQLGKIFNVSQKADSIIESMKNQISDTQAKIKKFAVNPKRVFVYDSGEDAPFTASGGLAKDIIKLSGGKDIFDDVNKSWATVTWEEVVKRNPEYIIIVDYDSSDDVKSKKQFLLSNPALKNVDAVKNDKIFVVGLIDFEAGERDSNTVRKIAGELYPEAFKN